MEFYSHPQIKLQDHLKTVADYMKKEIEKKIFGEKINPEVLKHMAFLIGICHDFGKYTSFFQARLVGENIDDKANHGLISALLGYWKSKKYFEEKELQEDLFFRYFPLIVFQIIKHHHGNLKQITLDVKIRENMPVIFEQIKDIQKNQKQIEAELDFSLDDFFNNAFTSTDDEDYPTQIEWELAHLEFDYNYSENNPDLKSYYFILNQYLYSLLISFDKRSAAQYENENENNLVFKEEWIKNFKKEKFQVDENYSQRVVEKELSDLNLYELRERVYQEVLANVKNADIQKNHIFTITSPTGTGKTLTSLMAAFKLGEKIKEKSGFVPQMIYSLPFTSIIEQNYGVIEEILKKIEDFQSNKNQYLLKHHYFSNVAYQSEDENKPIDEALFYIENWDSQFVVTTFIQLFHTLCGYENKMLKKFYKMANSIIILDEIQNIPFEYWSLVNQLLNWICKYLNSYVILLTATKPLIFDESETKELLTNNEAFFKAEKLNRTKIIPELKIHTFKQLSEKLKEEIQNKRNSVSSALIILNTIASTLKIYEIIKNDAFFQDWKKIYLSTNITPFERKERIKAIKESTENQEKVLVITTQLIEAGVDIDMDLVLRDLCPVDSLIQSAGRANRAGKREKIPSKVFLIKLLNENHKNTPFASYIYDNISVKEGTEKIFEKEVSEKDYFKNIDRFFNIILEKKSKEKSKKLLDSIGEFYFKDSNPDQKIPVSQFQLIKEIPGYTSIFVELNEEAKAVWKKFMESRNEKDLLKRKFLFAEFKADFSKYIISIPNKFVAPDLQDVFKNQDLFYLSQSQLTDDLYNAQKETGTGYQREIAVRIF